jgi:5'(3')-deoxyribonucleotidase
MDISKYNLKKIVREKDAIYIDKKNNEIYFLLLDVMPKKANEIIKSRIKSFSIRVSEISHKSVFDIVFGE